MKGMNNKSTHVLEENLQNTTGLFVDKTRNTLDTTSAGKTTNSGLGDTYLQVSKGSLRLSEVHTLNVVTKNLTMTLSTTFAETLQRKKRQRPKDKSKRRMNLLFHLFRGQTCLFERGVGGGEMSGVVVVVVANVDD